MRFHDRFDAGRRLAHRIRRETLVDPIVLALPPGGVPVGFEVAHALGAPLGVIVIHSGRNAGDPDLMTIRERYRGAVKTSSMSTTDADAGPAWRSRQHWRRDIAHDRDSSSSDLHGRDVVVVDEAVTTGKRAEAALRSLRLRRPRALTLGIPVGTAEAVERLQSVADVVVCVQARQDLGPVDGWYDDFTPISTRHILDLLAHSEREVQR